MMDRDITRKGSEFFTRNEALFDFDERPLLCFGSMIEVLIYEYFII